MSQDYVLIAGAGPVGLTAAHRIARHGVPVRIIDMAGEPTPLSKALVIWRRTLQVLDATIPYETFLAAGHEARHIRMIANGKLLAEIPLANPSHQLPGGVFIPQSETERILTTALAEQGVTVERHTKLLDLSQDQDGVTCQLEGPDGNEECRCSWLIGCDGAHSVTRHRIHLDFPGESMDQRWILGDVDVDTATDPHEAVIESVPGGIVAMFPVGVSRWRIMTNTGEVDADTPLDDPTEEELQAILDQKTHRDWKIVKSHWRSEFRVNERQVERYVEGRVLLAGDAAHVHSPAGGQGMNTGIQDAANLAWKVALAWKGGADRAVIETYQEERHPVGREVVDSTARMLRTAMITNPILRQLRDMALHIGLAIPAVRHHLTDFLNEETVHLRDSSLSGPLTKRADVQPGDAFPDVPISISGRQIPSTELLRGSEAACIVLGDVDVAALEDSFGSNGSGFPLNIVRVGQDADDVRDLAHAFGFNEQGVVLVRPDSVVAIVGTTAEVVTDYLSQWGRA